MAFPDNCSGRTISVEASNGCSLTRANILAQTPNDFEAQGFKEIGMDKVYASAVEARKAGFVESTLTEILMSNIKNIKGQLITGKIGASQSVILPYISRRQKTNINQNYWKVVSGAATPGAGSNGIPSHAWDVIVDNPNTTYATVLPVADLYRYFIPGKYFFVEYTNSAGTALLQTYKIHRASTTSSVTTVTLIPNYTEAGFAALGATDQAAYQVNTRALGFLGANSVSDFESHSGQYPALNNQSLIHFFLQTSRTVHEYSDEYLRALTAPLTSHYFKDFRQLDLAEQKRQQARLNEIDWLNSVFYGNRINENQSVETYASLEQVVDTANPSCVLEYKANALGFEPLLRTCGQVTDGLGAAFSLDTLFSHGYDIKRRREADGSSVDTVDIMGNRFDFGRFSDIMRKFYMAKYGVVSQRNYQPGQEVKGADNQIVFNYDRFVVPPELGGYDLAFFTHRFFDDKLSSSGNANASRAMYMLDFSDVEVGIAATNTVPRMTNEHDELYKYQMKINMKHVLLQSKTWTSIIEDPKRHRIYKGFADVCPTITATGCEIPNVSNVP